MAIAFTGNVPIRAPTHGVGIEVAKAVGPAAEARRRDVERKGAIVKTVFSNFDEARRLEREGKIGVAVDRLASATDAAVELGRRGKFVTTVDEASRIETLAMTLRNLADHGNTDAKRHADRLADAFGFA